MGEAKRRQKEKEELESEMDSANRKFNSRADFPVFNPSNGNINLHAVKAYHHLMRLIFIRAKHIHNALVKEFKTQNMYTAFILLKAYWETVAMLGGVYLTSERFIRYKRFSELLDWITKQSLGGKKFPTDEMLLKIGSDRENFIQTNFYTLMEKVDKYLDGLRKDKKSNDFQFRQTYDEFIAEAGHPTFLGLSICEEDNNDGSIIPSLSKISNIGDNMASLNYLSIANTVFFHFWEKFNENINK